MKKIINSPILQVSNAIAPTIRISRNFEVSNVSQVLWEIGNPYSDQGTEVWYTDGSKLDDGKTGAGIYGYQLVTTPQSFKRKSMQLKPVVENTFEEVYPLGGSTSRRTATQPYVCCSPTN